MESLKCPICCVMYDNITRMPYSILSCNHTFCTTCIEGFKGLCPNDREPFTQVMKNFALLDVIEEYAEGLITVLNLSRVKVQQVNEEKKESKRNRRRGRGRRGNNNEDQGEPKENHPKNKPQQRNNIDKKQLGVSRHLKKDSKPLVDMDPNYRSFI